MTNQPDALRLAEILDCGEANERGQRYAAAELRRLHEVNRELVEELTEMLSWQSLAPEHVVISAKAALAKAELAKPEQDHGFDRTASHMAGEYVDTAEQEPVAWMYNGHLHECDPSDWALDDVIPLYTSPPRKEWVGLTDEEMEQTCYETFSLDPYEIARAIEAKLRSKNENS